MRPLGLQPWEVCHIEFLIQLLSMVVLTHPVVSIPQSGALVLVAVLAACSTCPSSQTRFEYPKYAMAELVYVAAAVVLLEVQHLVVVQDSLR